MNRFREKIYRFMQGRYGSDQLTRFILGCALVFMLLSWIFKSTIISMLIWILLIYCYWRMFSRNISARYHENQVYLEKTRKNRSFFNQEKRLMNERKYNHIYTCPSCKQKIRIPKGKGKIEIRCPKCGTSFIKNS